MPAEQIARNLAFVNWTLLAALAVGSFGVVVLLRLRTDATKGYLGFTALCAAGFGALAWLSDGALPAAAAAGSPVTVDPAWDVPRRAALGPLRGGRAGLRRAPLPRPAGGPARARGGGRGSGRDGARRADVGWGSGRHRGACGPAARPGGGDGRRLRGHDPGPLVPRDPEALDGPRALLVRRAMLGVVAVQLVLFGLWVGRASGPTQAPLEPLTGPWALFVWLRLIVSLVFPLIVSWAAVQTVKTRSMESATGLLYINVALIAAGTIVAAGLYFGAGLLV